MSADILSILRFCNSQFIFFFFESDVWLREGFWRSDFFLTRVRNRRIRTYYCTFSFVTNVYNNSFSLTGLFSCDFSYWLYSQWYCLFVYRSQYGVIWVVCFLDVYYFGALSWSSCSYKRFLPLVGEMLTYCSVFRIIGQRFMYKVRVPLNVIKEWLVVCFSCLSSFSVVIVVMVLMVPVLKTQMYSVFFCWIQSG